MIRNISDINRIISNKKQPHQDVQRQPIRIADTYHDDIPDKVELRDHVDCEIKIGNDDR